MFEATRTDRARQSAWLPSCYRKRDRTALFFLAGWIGDRLRLDARKRRYGGSRFLFQLFRLLVLAIAFLFTFGHRSSPQLVFQEVLEHQRS
jgi:hypothetical protein